MGPEVMMPMPQQATGMQQPGMMPQAQGMPAQGGGQLTPEQREQLKMMLVPILQQMMQQQQAGGGMQQPQMM